MYLVSPFGERRADMRAAHHTANVIAAQAGKQIDESDYQAMVKTLMSYLPCDMEQDPNEEDVNEQALKRVKEQ